MSLKLQIRDKNNSTISFAEEEKRVTLVHKSKYHKGDKIVFSCDAPGFYILRLDDAVAPALVYIKERVEFAIPFGNMERKCYSPRAFKGWLHLLTAEIAEPSQAAARRNLALNPLDQRGTEGMWPHAVTNVERIKGRGSQFDAHNAIDGICASNCHFLYPYQSWGINKNPNAELTVEFGIPVIIDELVLTLRADFPHDSHWTKGTVEFSDGGHERLTFEKSGEPQHFSIAPRTVTSMTLKKLIKAEDDSEFPALRQMEAWGTVASEKE